MKSFIAGAVAVAALVAPQLASAKSGASLSLQVIFSTSGTIVVTLPDGTPVGTTSGSPTSIPAGFYTLYLSGPGGCQAVPHWTLKGPGEQITDNLNEGESAVVQYQVNFQPNSTYTWSNEAFPGVIHTFVTTSQVLGTPSNTSPNGLSSSNHTTISSTDLVGSGLLPFRGSLSGAVTSSGKLMLARNGKSVSALKAGKYNLVVNDQSSKTGFVLRKSSKTVAVTGAHFTGKRSMIVSLTAGKWTAGATAIAVSG